MPCYLLHFDRPYKHARHYLGFSKTLETMKRRIDTHTNATAGDGQNHRLLVKVREEGIGFTVSRIWEEATRQDERRWKRNGGGARLCPICRGRGL